VRMFLDEARLAALLQHANIAQVFDVGEIDGEYIMAMEYVAGRDVAALIAAARRAGSDGLPVGQALAIATEVASGLHHAHERCDASGHSLGIVHRDVSPSNVVVDFDGKVKLLDFGVAKSALPRSATKVGTVKGKLRYMSPEQLQARPIDRRSDLFSLGALLYAMVAGAPPFDGPSDATIVRRLVCGPAMPLDRRRPDTPPELGALVSRLLAKQPEDRPATAEDVQMELEAIARRAELMSSSIGLARYLRDLIGAPEPAPVVAGDHTPPPDEPHTASAAAAPAPPRGDGGEREAGAGRGDQSAERLGDEPGDDDAERRAGDEDVPLTVDEVESLDLTQPVPIAETHPGLSDSELLGNRRGPRIAPPMAAALVLAGSLLLIVAAVGLRHLRGSAPEPQFGVGQLPGAAARPPGGAAPSYAPPATGAGSIAVQQSAAAAPPRLPRPPAVQPLPAQPDPGPAAQLSPDESAAGDVPSSAPVPIAGHIPAPAPVPTAAPLTGEAALDDPGPSRTAAASPTVRRLRRGQRPRAERESRGRSENEAPRSDQPRAQPAPQPSPASAPRAVESTPSWDPDSPLLPSQRKRLENRGERP